jgi:hypothetical protein
MCLMKSVYPFAMPLAEDHEHTKTRHQDFRKTQPSPLQDQYIRLWQDSSCRNRNSFLNHNLLPPVSGREKKMRLTKKRLPRQTLLSGPTDLK